MIPSDFLRRLGPLAALAALFIAGKLGLRLVM